MAREQLPDISIGAEALRPVARPVSTYVRPAQPQARNGLHDLARGLAAFDKGMGDFLAVRQEKQNEEDFLRGRAAFDENHSVEWGEAVQRGLVPAHHSPAFMKGYKRTQGNVAGIKLREQFNREYQTWGGRNSDNPEDFDAFLQDFLERNVGTDDPDILKSLLPHIDALTEDGYRTYETERGERTYGNAVATEGALSGDIVEYSVLQSGEEGINTAALIGDLEGQRAAALANGIAAEDFDKTLVATIAAKALEYGDEDILKLLDHRFEGQGVELSKRPEVADEIRKTKASIVANDRAKLKFEWQLSDREDKVIENNIITHVMRTLVDDPMAQIDEEIIKRWEVIDGTARKQLTDLRKSMMEGEGLEDRETILQFERKILEGWTEKDLLRAAAQGDIKNPTTLRTLLDRAERRRESMLSGDGVLSLATTKSYKDTIRQRTMGDEFDPNVMFDPGGLTDEGLEATRDFEIMLMEWEAENPNATALEREKAVHEIGGLIVQRIDQNTRQYTSQQDADQMRQEAQTATETGGPTAQPPGEAPQENGANQGDVGTTQAPSGDTGAGTQPVGPEAPSQALTEPVQGSPEQPPQGEYPLDAPTRERAAAMAALDGQQGTQPTGTQPTGAPAPDPASQLPDRVQGEIGLIESRRAFYEANGIGTPEEYDRQLVENTLDWALRNNDPERLAILYHDYGTGTPLALQPEYAQRVQAAAAELGVDYTQATQLGPVAPQEQQATEPQVVEPQRPSLVGQEQPSRSFWRIPTRQEFKEATEIDAGIGRPREEDSEAYKLWRGRETYRLYSGDEPPSLDDMDASYRRRMEADAAAMGMTTEEYNMDLFTRVKNWLSKNAPGLGADPRVDGPTPPPGTVDETITNSIGDSVDEAVRTGLDPYLDRGGKDPYIQSRKEFAYPVPKVIREVDPMLTLLGKSEGTDKARGYNETLSYGAYTGGDVDLVNMTLGEIDKLQTRMLRHPKNKWNSSAVGRYQIVRTTLRKLKKQMGLKDTDVFTPQLQDAMALQLLRGRGLDRWKAGTMSDSAFLRELSKEWASVPKDANGKSYYSNQRAGTSVSTMKKTFEAMKALQG